MGDLDHSPDPRCNPGYLLTVKYYKQSIHNNYIETKATTTRWSAESFCIRDPDQNSNLSQQVAFVFIVSTAE